MTILDKYAGLAAVTVIQAHTVIQLFNVRTLLFDSGKSYRTLGTGPKTQDSQVQRQLTICTVLRLLDP
jgi:hypothetical protein